jgi:hypothetical protein
MSDFYPTLALLLDNAEAQERRIAESILRLRLTVIKQEHGNTYRGAAIAREYLASLDAD